MAKKPTAAKTVEALKHEDAKCKNIPTAEYRSVLDEQTRNPTQVCHPRKHTELLYQAAALHDAGKVSDAFQQVLNRDLDPQLVWRGKDEQHWSDLVVHAPPLYIQERVHPKTLIDGLHAIHYAGSRKLESTAADQAHAAEQKRISPPVAHPVARVHPETGRKAIYLGEKVRRFDGMTEDESRPLIDCLNRHATRPEFVYRHRWRPHDILVWDNRSTMHQALADFDQTQSRYMERTTVYGTPSGYVVTEA